MKHLFFSAGELSGDLHAANVIRRLEGCRVSGIGGDSMIAAGLTPIRHIRETAVMGFTEVAMNYFRLRRIFHETCRYIEEKRPDLVVLVDYPGFNLRLARFAKSRGLRVLYYIAPKVWAWGSGRIKALRNNVDRLAVIFPFEEAYFKERGLHADYVGNPNIETELSHMPLDAFFRATGLSAQARILGVLPGSRTQEVTRILPPMAGAARILLDEGRFDACVVSQADGLPDNLLRRLLPDDPRFRLFAGRPGPVYESARFLFVKSGTATYEAARYERPFLVAHRASPLTTFLVRRLVNLTHYSMINLILPEPRVPELIQERAAPGPIAAEARALLDHPDRMAAMVAAFQKLKADARGLPPSEKVAHLIQEMIHG
ncbi:MAG: lipid-A-disaccharide synthase [Fibrobacterota bacterium]